jgi:hypothetical protein
MQPASERLSLELALGHTKGVSAATVELTTRNCSLMLVAHM